MSESHITHHTGHPPGQGHEKTDINPKTMGIWIIGLFLTMIVACLFVKAVFHYNPLLHYQVGAFGVNNQYRIPDPILEISGPKLQPVPGQELRNIEARDNAFLNGYGWADKAAGTVHIPIEQAIDRIASEGLPARSGDEAQPR